MAKRLFSLLLLLFPSFLFAQSAFSDCDIVFTSVEHLPSLKISNEAFEDTLGARLKSKKFVLKDNEIAYKFVVTRDSKIDDLTIESGDVGKEKLLREVLLELTYLWQPAIQNGHVVCSYVILKLRFEDNNINVEIAQ